MSRSNEEKSQISYTNPCSSLLLSPKPTRYETIIEDGVYSSSTINLTTVTQANNAPTIFSPALLTPNANTPSSDNSPDEEDAPLQSTAEEDYDQRGDNTTKGDPTTGYEASMLQPRALP